MRSIRGGRVQPSRRRRAALLAAFLAALVALGAAPALADVFTSSATATHTVRGAVLERYRALGGPSGVLGYPTTDELATPYTYGAYNHFQRGSIYWSPASGAHQVGGAIRDRWIAYGLESGALGFPTTGELSTAGGRGRYNEFQRGRVYWSAATGARMVRGAILTEYAARGAEAGGWACRPPTSPGPRTGRCSTTSSGEGRSRGRRRQGRTP